MRPAIGGRWAWLLGCAIPTFVVFAGCGAGPTATPTVVERSASAAPNSAKRTPSPKDTKKPTPTESFTVHESCAEVVAKMSLSEQTGQLLMIGVSSGGISASEKTIRRGDPGRKRHPAG